MIYLDYVSTLNYIIELIIPLILIVYTMYWISDTIEVW